MQELLIQLGLKPKEVKFYLYMLEAGSLTAQEIAKANKETRTNTYMILERLISEKLIEVDEGSPIKRFIATDPVALKDKLLKQQQELKQKHMMLTAALPDLSALFRLSQHKPGVMYLEGIKGFKALLDDNAKATTQIDLIASEDIVHDREAWAMLQKGIAKRWAKGIKTRGLFNTPDEEWNEVKTLQNTGYKVRRWGKDTLPGEIVIYDNKVAFTAYHPVLIVTILTNDVIADTFRAVFEHLWEKAKE